MLLWTRAPGDAYTRIRAILIHIVSIDFEFIDLYDCVSVCVMISIWRHVGDGKISDDPLIWK